eukprot:1100176_1
MSDRTVTEHRNRSMFWILALQDRTITIYERDNKNKLQTIAYTAENKIIVPIHDKICGCFNENIEFISTKISRSTMDALRDIATQCLKDPINTNVPDIDWKMLKHVCGCLLTGILDECL